MKNYVIIILLFVCVTLAAQTQNEPKYLLTTKASTIGFSLPSFTDPYLSPLVYSGIGVIFQQDNRRFFTEKDTNFSMQSKFGIAANMLLNPTLSTNMFYLDVNYGWGFNYHFRINKQLKILAGGLMDIDLGFKDVPRNVNNPINLDMAANLNLTGLFMYDYPLPKRVLHFQIAFLSPILGYMFVPPGGASYYDMFELGNMKNTFHFSSLINKRGLDQKYTVDVPLDKITWRFGLHFLNMKYSANNLVFTHKELSLIVGTTFDAISFSGRKKNVPHNFMSINE